MADEPAASQAARRERLARHRKALGLTQEALADLLGVERSTVVRWERGETEPLPSIRARLAKALRVPADRLEELLISSAAPGGSGTEPRTGRDSTPVVPRQLPAAVTEFTGRAVELAALTRIVEEACTGAPGTVVISAIGGTAGVGKTALAVHWAHQVSDRFPNGQLYVNLRGYDAGQPVPAADALAGFLRALGAPGQEIPPETDERAARYRSLLAGKRMLVILDNAGSADQVRPLLPGSRYAGLFSLLKLTHQSAGQIVLVTQVTGGDEALLESFLAQITQGVGSPVAQTRPVGAEQAILGSAANRQMPWLQATQTLNGSGANHRGKYESAYMIKPFPARQVTAIHAALTDPSYDNPQALLQVDSYGCQVNARKPDATAVAQRSSIMKLQYQTYWTDPADDGVNLNWIRHFYQTVYAASGGTPVSNGITDGCYVNYPDVDLTNYSTLYYKQNYPRLQRVKARWDPTNAFNYSQSIRLP